MNGPTDIFGVEAKEGDYIAAGMTEGRSSVLRIGRIIKINMKDAASGNYSINVQWTHNGVDNPHQWDTSKSSIFIKRNYRYAKFAVLDPEYVSKFPTQIKEDN